MIRRCLLFLLFLAGVFAALPGVVHAYSEDTQEIDRMDGNYGQRGQMISPVNPMVVTSPQGWRIHPIEGTWKYHSGVDLAADYDQEVYAATSGVVYSAGWVSGYGNTVIIDHGGNLYTLYGHNNACAVEAGQSVAQGQVIAYAGSTGNSTGPHCHFEVLPNGIYGDPVDPGLYVPGLLDMEKALGGGNGGGAAPQDAHGAVKDWVVANDFAKPIRDVIEKLTELITKALDILKTHVAKIFFILVSIDIALAAMLKAMRSTEEDREGLFPWIVRRGLFYGFCCVLLFGWGDFVGNLSLHGLPQIGALVGGDAAAAEAAVSDPTLVVQKGMNIIAQVINQAMQVHSILDFVFHGKVALACLVFGVILFALFCIIGYQIAMAYIEFYLTILFSFMSFTFAGLKHVRKYASNGISGVFAASLNLMFFCLFALMLQMTMQNLVVGNLAGSTTIKATSTASAEPAKLPGTVSESAGSQGADLTGKPKAELAYRVQALLRARGYELRADWIWAQMAHESSYFTSPLAVEDHNYAGMGYNGSTYTHYDTDEEFAQDYARTLAAYAEDGLFEAKTVEEYAAALRHGHYYTAPLEEYIQGMKGALGQGGGSITQSFANVALLLQLTLVVLLYMFFADRMSKFILTQFGGGGFRLSKDG